MLFLLKWILQAILVVSLAVNNWKPIQETKLRCFHPIPCVGGEGDRLLAIPSFFVNYGGMLHVKHAKRGGVSAGIQDLGGTFGLPLTHPTAVLECLFYLWTQTNR